MAKNQKTNGASRRKKRDSIEFPAPNLKSVAAAIRNVEKRESELVALEDSEVELTNVVNTTNTRDDIDEYLRAKGRLEVLPREKEQAEQALEEAEAELKQLLGDCQDYVVARARATAAELISKIAKLLRPYCRHIEQAETLANSTDAVQTLYKADQLFVGDDALAMGKAVIKFLRNPDSFELKREYVSSVGEGSDFGPRRVEA
jgi:vacuolar-type H+-ATPase subunit I/STV1